MEVSTVVVELDKLELGVFTPRQAFDEGWVKELAEDIKLQGLQKPIIVRPHPTSPGRFQVIDGEHRVRAVRLLGNTSIRAEVRELSDEQATFLAMRINELHGKRLTVLEEAAHILRLNRDFGWTEQKIAEMFGRSRQWVSDRVRIANNISEDLRECHARGKISHTHAREIVELPKEEQASVARKVVEEGLNSRETAVLVHALRSAPSEEERRRVLESPVKALFEAYGEERKVLEAAISEKEELIETFACPKCGMKLVVDWVGKRVKWVE